MISNLQAVQKWLINQYVGLSPYKEAFKGVAHSKHQIPCGKLLTSEEEFTISDLIVVFLKKNFEFGYWYWPEGDDNRTPYLLEAPTPFMTASDQWWSSWWMLDFPPQNIAHWYSQEGA